MFPHRWLPVALGILNESFNEENGMMNSAMKIVTGQDHRQIPGSHRLALHTDGQNRLQ